MAPTPVNMSSISSKWWIEALSIVTTEQGFVEQLQDWQQASSYKVSINTSRLTLPSSLTQDKVITVIALIQFVLRVCIHGNCNHKLKWCSASLILSHLAIRMSMEGSNSDSSTINSALVSSLLWMAILLSFCLVILKWWMVLHIVEGCTLLPVTSSSSSHNSCKYMLGFTKSDCRIVSCSKSVKCFSGTYWYSACSSNRMYSDTAYVPLHCFFTDEEQIWSLCSWSLWYNHKWRYSRNGIFIAEHVTSLKTHMRHEAMVVYIVGATDVHTYLQCYWTSNVESSV